MTAVGNEVGVSVMGTHYTHFSELAGEGIILAKTRADPADTSMV
jgi:hypothetical protein